MKGSRIPHLRFLGIGFTHAQILSQYAGSGLFHKMPGLPINTGNTWFAGMIAGIVTLVVCGAVFRGSRLRCFRKLLAPSIILNIVGLLLSIWPVSEGVPAALASFLGAMGLGIGSSIMFLLWADVFNGMKIEDAEIALPLSSVIVLIYAVAAPLLPGGFDGILMLVAPLASGSMLYLAFKESPKTFQQDAASAAPSNAPSSLARELVCISIPLFLFYATLSWNGVVSQHELVGSRSVPDIVGSLTGVLCAIGFVFFSFKTDFAALFRWLCPLATVALVLNFWDSEVSSLVICSISSVLDITIWIVTYLYCLRKARSDYDISIARVAALLAVSHLGAIAGNMLAAGVLTSLGHVDHSIVQVISLVLICSVVSATMGIVGRPTSRIADEWHENANAVPSDVSSRCKAISERQGLTARELDVLILLAMGRSQPYICEYLTLSKSTVSTHVGHIYQKCDVHSRQELLDCINE